MGKVKRNVLMLSRKGHVDKSVREVIVSMRIESGEKIKHQEGVQERKALGENSDMVNFTG